MAVTKPRLLGTLIIAVATVVLGVIIVRPITSKNTSVGLVTHTRVAIANSYKASHMFPKSVNELTHWMGPATEEVEDLRLIDVQGARATYVITIKSGWGLWSHETRREFIVDCSETR